METTLSLDEKSYKPIIEVATSYKHRALLDTGSDFPVWVRKENMLLKLGAKPKLKNVPFGGFGGEVKGNLYTIDLYLGNLIYKDLPIIAHEMSNLNFGIILSAPMFQNMVYTIDTIHNKLELKTFDNQVVRHLKVKDSKGDITVLLAGTYETVEEYNAHVDSE